MIDTVVIGATLLGSFGAAVVLQKTALEALFRVMHRNATRLHRRAD